MTGSVEKLINLIEPGLGSVGQVLGGLADSLTALSGGTPAK
ncbi:hypothetical protein [Tomitella fengzijianii]|nr:hypothetical protein [Tomitella fengzijianii]